MQGKIRAVPTLAYGEPMAETEAHRARCPYSQNPQMPNAHPPNALCPGRVFAPSRPALFTFSSRRDLPVSMPYRPSRSALFAFLETRLPPPLTNCKLDFRILNRTVTSSCAPRGVGKRYRSPLDFLPRGYLCSSRATGGTLDGIASRPGGLSYPSSRATGGALPF